MAAVKSRHHLSFEENVAAIKKNTSGTSVLTISDEFNGGKTQIYSILKNKAYV